MPVTSKHPLYQTHVKEWEDCQNFYDGEAKVKSLGTRYLPKPEQATLSEYKAYVMRAFFFPAIERTVAGLAGAIDRKPPSYSLSQRTAYLEWDADSNKVSLRQFSKLCLDRCFIKGRYGILVERPESGGNPYLALYDAEDIINWKEDPDLGLELVVLRETYYESQAADEFVLEEKTQYRVLRLIDGRYVQHVYTNSIAGAGYVISEEIIPTKAGQSLDFIPFVFGNARSTTARIDKPPLLDLVRKNAEHYRVSADYANALYFTGNPILWVKGVKRPRATRPVNPGEPQEPDFKLTLGSQRAIYLPTVDSEIGMTECSGHGVSPNHDKAEDIKKEMAVLGARLLETQRTSGVEAAETVYLRQSGESSVLVNIVLSVSATIRRALEMADIWLGGTGDEIDFMLNMDFVDVRIDPAMVSNLADLVSKELISWDTFIYNLTSGELMPPGRTAEEERALIEAQPPMSNPLGMLQGMGLPPQLQEQGGQEDGQDENTPQ